MCQSILFTLDGVGSSRGIKRSRLRLLPSCPLPLPLPLPFAVWMIVVFFLFSSFVVFVIVYFILSLRFFSFILIYSLSFLSSILLYSLFSLPFVSQFSHNLFHSTLPCFCPLVYTIPHFLIRFSHPLSTPEYGYNFLSIKLSLSVGEEHVDLRYGINNNILTQSINIYSFTTYHRLFIVICEVCSHFHIE